MAAGLVRDAGFDPVIVGPVGAGHPDRDHRRRDIPIGQQAVDHVVERLLDGEFPAGADVGAGPHRLADDAARLVGQQAVRLRSARVDPNDVLHGGSPPTRHELTG